MHLPRELQVEDLRRGIPALPNLDTALQLFHDETNNVRRLRLGALGLNVPDNKTFVIGGVALMPGASIEGWPQLRALLRIQPSALEIKFDHLAKGTYEDVLGSRKIASFLQWLLDQQMMVHYSALDPLYWSILDVIESLQADPRFQIVACHMELKSELLHAAKQDLASFFSLLFSFHYPNVLRHEVRRLIEAVAGFVDHRVPVDRNAATFLLKQTLRRAARLQDLELAFLHENKVGELIDDFSIQFLHRVYLFKNAVHVFDEETFVEQALAGVVLRDGARRLDYRFADSKDEPGIQLSDVVAGLLGRHFNYVQEHPLQDLMQRRSRFSDVQRASLNSLRALIDRSDAFCPALFHVILPMDTQLKNAAFLHDEKLPYAWL